MRHENLILNARSPLSHIKVLFIKCPYNEYGSTFYIKTSFNGDAHMSIT